MTIYIQLLTYICTYVWFGPIYILRLHTCILVLFSTHTHTHTHTHNCTGRGLHNHDLQAVLGPLYIVEAHVPIVLARSCSISSPQPPFLQQTLLLGFSSPSPLKEVEALFNLELSGDATSGRATPIRGDTKHCYTHSES